jgi:ABC-2 type transport system permease protein
LGKIQGSELVWGLAIEAMWIAVFLVASRVLFRRGLVRYSGFGG